jgi:hypothetical protein
MDALSFAFKVLDVGGRLLYGAWVMVIGIPGVLRHGVGFWNKDKGKSNVSDGPN